MKGQIRVEFIFSVVLFGGLFILIAMFMNSAFTMFTNDAKIDIIKTRTYTTAVILMEDKEKGLAVTPYILNETKIAAFNSTRDSEGRCTSLLFLNLSGYRLKIWNATTMLLDCGYFGIPVTYMEKSIGIITDGRYSAGNMTLELW